MNQQALDRLRHMVDLDRITVTMDYEDNESDEVARGYDSDSSAERELKLPGAGERYHFDEPDANLRNHEKFFLLDKIDGFVPKMALPYKYLDNKDYETMIKKEKRFKFTREDWDDIEHGSKLLEREEHDPESLNDEDIDMLFDSTDNNNKSSNNNKAIATPEKVTTSEKNVEEINGEFIYKTLLISDNGFRFSGDTTVTLVKGGICDAAVINATNNKFDDLLLVVQSDGMLLSILPTKVKRNRKYVKTHMNSTVIQYWKLGERSDWKIVVDESSRKELNFVLIDQKASEVKFFRYTNDMEFELVNNMWFDDYKIHKSTFFVNKRNPYVLDHNGHIMKIKPDDAMEDEKSNPFMLFVSTEYCNRAVYFCIEWSVSDRFHKRVHQLTYQNGKPISDVIPLEHNKVLTFRNDSISLLSANQIMSGETSFLTTGLPNSMKGITSWFTSDILLQKIKNISRDQFQEYDDCIIASSATGTIFTCLINSTRIETYPLTRFKGLEFIFPAMNSSEDYDVPDFSVNVKSFGRIVAIKIDLEETISSNPGVGYDNIISRKTNDVSYDSNSEVAVINDNIWLFSKSSISQISNVLTKHGPIPFLKSSEVINNMKKFNLYTSIQLSKISAVEEWGKFLGISTTENEISVLVAKNEDLTDLYLIQQTVGNDHLDKETNLEFTNLEGILDNNFKTGPKVLFCAPYKEFLIYVDEETINILCITSGKCKTYKPRIPYNEVDFSFGAMILWHNDSSTGTYIVSYDITDNFEDENNGLNFSENNFDPESTETPTILQKRFFIDKINYQDTYELDIFMFRNNVFGREHWSKSEVERDIHTDIFTIQDLVVLNGLCVFHVDGPLLHIFKINGNRRYFINRMPLLPTGAQKVNLRKLTSTSVLAFTTDRIFVYDFKALMDNNCAEPEYYELKIPYQGKDNFILDVSVQPGTNLVDDISGCMIYILFSNGLKILQPSHFSEIYNNYILKYTRSKNKKFIYLKNLHRLAVINYDYNDWYCIKLENGKVLTLNNSVLEKDKILINVLDISLNSKDKGCDTLLFVFETFVRVVKILSNEGKIKIKCIASKEFEGRLSKNVSVTRAGIYLLAINTKERTPDDTFHFLHNMDEYKDVMYRITLKNFDTELEVTMAAPFYGKGELGMFEFYEEDYGMFTDVSREKLYQYYKTYDDDTFNISLTKLVGIPSGATVLKIIPIDKNTCAVAVKLSGRANYSSKLLFFGYHYNSLHYRKNEFLLRIRERTREAINEATQTDHSAIEGLKRENGVVIPYEEPRTEVPKVCEDIIDDGEMMSLPLSGNSIDPERYAIEEYDQFKGYGHMADCTVGRLYQTINISSLIQDATYNAEKGMIVVLCEDQSVLLFKAGLRYCTRDDNWKCYYSDNDYERQSDRTLLPRRPTKIHGFHMEHINRYGKIWEDI